MQDSSILASLVEEYLDICALPIMDERRRQWASLHGLVQSYPLIHTRFFAFHEMAESVCVCRDPILREVEYDLRRNIFWHSLHDDTVFEPWITLRAVFQHSFWGNPSIADAGKDGEHIKGRLIVEDMESWRSVLKNAVHVIDERETARRLEVVSEAIGDLIDIDVVRSPYYSHWHGDLSTDLGLMRGLHNVLYDVYDHPDELHAILRWMSEQVVAVQQEAERSGDWSLTSSVNQSMSYTNRLPIPSPNSFGVSQKEVWGFLASQEFTMVSPEMWDEFLLTYQKPILSRYGLTAYGCCEDLTDKIPYLKQIPNLRRIAVSPFSNLKRCVDQIETSYVISFRPNPTDMVCVSPDEAYIRKKLTEDLRTLKGTFYDITLKDVETVENNPHRVRNWVATVRRVCDEVGW
jgi:hypothetical protein